MKNRNYPIIILILMAFMSLTIPGCIDNVAGKDEEKNIIITTIVPIEDLTERISGDKAQVITLIPPGASPHSFEPSPGDLEMVEKARLFVKVGSGIEFELEWADKIIGMNKDMAVVDCSKSITLISSDDEKIDGYDAHDEDMDEHDGNYVRDDEGMDDHGNSHGTDPHIWLSPLNAKKISQNIYEGLIEVDPGNKEYYKGNLEELLAQLEDLDSRIRDILSGSKNRKILVFHPAWAYFAQEYGLEQIAVQEEGKEPTIKSMELLIRQAGDEGIKVVFASPEFNTRSAEVIAEEIGGEVILVSPLPQDYMSDMEKIARAFEESME